MFDQLKTSLERLLPLTREEFVQFATLLTPRRLTKHEHWLRAGEVCTHINTFFSGTLIEKETINDGPGFDRNGRW